jgi:adenylate cyclase class 2
MSATRQYHETEIKLRFEEGPRAARTLLERLGYPESEPRTLESDQIFDRDGELKGSDRLLRLRRNGGRATITYKGPGAPGRHKSREEIEFDVSEPDACELALLRLGYQPGFRYEKYRTKFAAAGEPGLITIDETPMGVFLELEGEPDWIDRTAARIGHPPEKYLTSSYAALYREYRLQHPSAPQNMTFPQGGLSRTPEKES